MGSEMMLIVVALAGVALYFKGCDLGIKPICKIKSGGIGGGADTPADLPPPPPPGIGAPAAPGGDPNQMTGMPGAGPMPVIPGATGEMKPMSMVMEYVANQAVNDIDNNTYAELGVSLKFNLKATILAHYKTWLEKIAEYNGQTLKPLQGRALAKYASLILDVTRRMRIRLNPAADAMYRANLFAGTPMLGNATSGRAIIIS